MVLSFLTSKLSVHASKTNDDYYPGEVVKGYVRLNTLKGVDARNVKVSLCCVEWMNPKKNGDKDKEGKEAVIWEAEKKLGGKHKYSAGEWEFEFLLPKNALPTISPEPSRKHAHTGAGLKWYLHAQMDVPNSIDLHAFKQIFIY